MIVFFAAGFMFNLSFADRGLDFTSISDIELNLDLHDIEMLFFPLSFMATSIRAFLNGELVISFAG